jgi:hypothetical protein
VAKLKLGAIADDKPVKLTIELPAAVHRDLLAARGKSWIKECKQVDEVLRQRRGRQMKDLLWCYGR